MGNNAIKDPEDTDTTFAKETQQKTYDPLERLETMTDKGERMSIENFKEWRNYLYRYYLIVLAIIGGTGIFTNNSQTYSPTLNWGIYISFAGVFIGFFIINLYFYFEGKRSQIETHILGTNPYKLFNHPDAKNDIKLAMRLNVEDIIKKDKEELKKAQEENNKKEERFLKNTIKGNKLFIRSLKYYGAQSGFIERIWILNVILSFILPFIGMLMIFTAII